MRYWALLLLAFAMLAGCASEEPAIWRVQPNVIDKQVFNGDDEWYFLQTVIDTPYTAGYTFVGEQGTTERVVWEIQEDYLIARRSYELIANAEDDGIAGETISGAAVAMYKIEKHFDIRRAYNPITGEEQNLVEENASDRPWYERDYMRVDWSKNLITETQFLLGARIFDGIQAESVAYVVPPGSGHPHEPQFCDNENDCMGLAARPGTAADAEVGDISYFDIVNKMFVKPTTAYLEGLGEVPTCLLMNVSDCAPGEITVRNSFLRVDTDGRDYEPFVYTGDRMERFGYFTSDRNGYDPEYGVVNPERFHFANRHNLWQQSHARNNGAYIDCTEANEMMVCGDQGGRCDLNYARANRRRNDAGEWLGVCTMPYREREVRPIAYHLSSNFPEDLISNAEQIADEWNAAFVETVSSLRENECTSTGGEASACASERMRADHQRMFVLCHNPVLDSDHDACGPTGTSAEIGDLRYSFLGWVNEAHARSPLGYGPSSADPITGEIIMGNAFIYGAGIDTLQAFARDIIGLLNGDLRETDISSGDVVRSWVERNREPRSLTTGRPADDHIAGIDAMNVDRINEAMDFSWVDRFSGGNLGNVTTVADTLRVFEEARERLGRQGAFGDGTDRGAAQLSNLIGTDVEQMLTDPEIQIAAGVDPSLVPDNDDVLDAASPLRGMRPARLNVIERARQRMEAESHCMLHADFADDGLLGLARAIDRAANTGDGTMEWYGTSFQIRQDDGTIDYAAVSRMIRQPIFHGVTAHEIGHTIGLRHNFSGSYDALNYNPRYWELRDDGNMAPRAQDPMTQAEIDGRITEYQYSTVMDYGNNFVVTDAQGVGHYDHAAVKMGYGDMVEVFTNVSNVRDVTWWNFIQNAGWPVPLKLSSFTGGELAAYEYTDWPEIAGGREALQQRADVAYTSLQPESFLASQGIRDPMVDAQGRPAVPYIFCTDNQADLGPDCYRYDAGADPYETVNSVIDNYWNYYIFNAFGRGRLNFDVQSYASRIRGRYFQKLKYANQIYSLYRAVFGEIFGDRPDFDRFFTRPDGMGAYTAAVGSAFQLLTRVVATPEPGGYGVQTRGDGSEALLSGSNSILATNIDSFEGRGIETRWDQDLGFYWSEQILRAGFSYDKTLAIQMLVDPQTNFLGRDTAADVRRYQINFYRSFAPAMTAFFRGLLSEQWSVFAPRVSGSDLIYPDALEMVENSASGVPVDPNANFTTQLAGAVYGMAFIPETFDRTYFQQSRIWVDGGSEAITPAPGTSIVTFTDEATGLIYNALSNEVGGEEMAPGAQMLLHAQALADNGADGELALYMDNINVVRRLSWLFEWN